MSRVDPVDPRVRLAIVQWPPDAPRGSITTFCAAIAYATSQPDAVDVNEIVIRPTVQG